MPSTYNRLILGAGTTAATYLSFFPPRPDEKVGVIGMPDPWSRRGEHRMGQPPHLLMLPLAQPSRAAAFPAHRRLSPSVPDDANEPPSDPFLKSNVFAEQIAFDVKYRHARVTSVTRISQALKVSYQYSDSGAKKYLHAREVIVATGPGPAQQTPVYTNGAPDGVFRTGDAYLDHHVAVRGKVVAVEGGSATAAWCAEKALLGEVDRVYWFTRKKAGEGIPERFAQAFPAGKRNDWLNGHPKVTMLVANVVGTEWAAEKLRVRFQNADPADLLVDQYVAALGAEETAQYLDDDIRNDLAPIVDTEGHLHPDGNCVLAYHDSKDEVLIVGAGIFRLSGAQPQSYTKSNEYLPRAARPPEGVPTIIATLGTLCRYLRHSKSAWLDINLANFADLDDHFRRGIAQTFGVVLSHRTGAPLELTSRFVTDQVVGTRIMKSSPYGISLEELATLYDNITGQDSRELSAMLRAFA
jgi:hypothetical protein